MLPWAYVLRFTRKWIWQQSLGGPGLLGVLEEDAELSSVLVSSYIVGFQGKELGKQSVSTMTKHFPGGGPQMGGQDPHFTYGREQIYPGNNRSYHIQPFRAAIKAGGSQMMPYYGMPMGTDWEEVGFAFSKSVIRYLLKEELGFKGIVCTDWGLITDTTILGQDMPARAWGVEHLSESERVLKILNAGCDQFGGESRPELVVQLVKESKLSEARLDESVRLLLREKFVLGLFDHPFVDVEEAVKIVGNEAFQMEADEAQRRSFCLLTNRDILPLSDQSHNRKVYVEGILPDLVSARGFQVVSDPHDADLALLRLKAPFEPRPGGFEAHFHAGSLEYSREEKARQAMVLGSVPSIVDVYLDRPAIIPELAQEAAALLVNFGSSADAFLDVVLGKTVPEGRLPFDLPSSMKAVEESREDMQYDTKDPLFRFGHGLGYS
jgi:beta-glucosidase